MKEFFKNNKKNMIIAIAILFCISIYTTYAYFSATLRVDEGPNDIIAETGVLSLNYIDGPYIRMTSAYPGDYVEKTFSVSNTGTFNTEYSINWKTLNNGITNDELLISLNCTSYINYDTDNEEVSGTCENLLPQSVGYSVSDPIKANIEIARYITHVYTLRVEFMETNAEQNYNQGKTFAGEIQINEYTEDNENVPLIREASISNLELSANIEDNTGVIGYSITEPEQDPSWINVPSDNNVNIEIPVDDYDKTLWVKNRAGTVVNVDLTPESTVIVNPNGGSIPEVASSSKLNRSATPNNGKIISGISAPHSYSLKYKETLIINDPVRDSYTFTGWQVIGERSVLDGKRFTMGITSSTIIATWDANTFILTVDPNGGTWDGNQNEEVFSMDYGTSKHINDPIRTGYTFTGWELTENTTSTLNSNNFVIGGENCTLTATWVINSYAWIAYHYQQNVTGSGYTLISADTEKKSNIYKTSVTPQTKTYTGFDSPALQTITIEVEENDPPTTNKVDYNYSRHQHSLTIYPNGGTYNGSASNTASTVYYGATIELLNPVKTGYNFSTWTKAGNGSTLNNNIFTMGDENASLTATWTAMTFTVTFNPNGGAVSTPTKVVTYDSTYGTLPTPTRSGFRFDGWYTLQSGGTRITSDNSVSITANQTLFAHWTQLVTLTQKILADNTAKSDASVNLAYSAEGKTNCSWNTSTNSQDCTYSASQVTNGLYYTSSTSKTEGGTRVYYYRGIVENNYLLFAGYCWRIVRTNEDGSVKLRYGGVPTGNTCPQTGTAVSIGGGYYGPSGAFTPSSDNTYVGFMYATISANTTSYAQAHVNSKTSTALKKLNTWYTTNIVPQGTAITNMIANTKYCNDRALVPSGGLSHSCDTKRGYGTNCTSYGAAARLISDTISGSVMTQKGNNANPTYVCSQTNDEFTLKVANGGTSGFGNNALDYPIGLLSADEVVYAGSGALVWNQSYFLHTGEKYWTMSPYGFGGSGVGSQFIVNVQGYLNVMDGNSSGKYLPVISLKSTTIVTSGLGKYNSPYIVAAP